MLHINSHPEVSESTAVDLHEQRCGVQVAVRGRDVAVPCASLYELLRVSRIACVLLLYIHVKLCHLRDM